MKKQSLTLLFLINAAVCFSQGNAGIDFLRRTLKDRGESKHVMVIAHRGDWRNAPENSLQAFKNCVDRGVDGIEIDVAETKDGELIVIHDRTLNRTTNGSGTVNEHTLAQIKELRLRGGNNVLTRHKVPTLEETFVLLKGKALIQVDKWGPVKDKVLALAKKHDCMEQLIFRSTAKAQEIKNLFGDDLYKVNFIPVITADGKKDLEKLQDYNENLRFDALGIAFKSQDYLLLKQIPSLQKKGVRIWFNAILGDKFNAGYDDDLAVDNPEKAYGFLVGSGASMIMTDRPFELIDYLKKHNRRTN